ncbi:MAG: diadenylate cyclase CdaA [Candidatus Omnitrophota bacterium]
MTNLISFWKPVTEIVILWFVIYRIMLFFEGTRAIHVIRGIVVLLIAFFVFQLLRFEVLDWLLERLFAISVIAILIIFHPEIRQGLARLGQRNIFGATALRQEDLDRLLKEIGNAAENLSKDKTGAIIALEKKDPLSAFIESGVVIDGRVSSELIESVFSRNSILHDGGMIIQQGRITAAGCLFPLSENQDLSRVFGTRHRAALGLSEDTDAIIIVVSEERQNLSLIYRGKMQKDLSREELIGKIKEFIKAK